MSDILVGDIESLTTEARLTLISRLWNSLKDRDIPLSEAQKQELDRRMLTLEEDQKAGIPWESLKAEMATRCP